MSSGNMLTNKLYNTEYILKRVEQYKELHIALATAVALAVGVGEDVIIKEEESEEEGASRASFCIGSNIYYFSKASDTEVYLFYYVLEGIGRSILEKVSSLESFQAIADRIKATLVDTTSPSELNVIKKMHSLFRIYFDRVEYRIIDNKYHITVGKGTVEIEYTLTKDDRSLFTLETIRVPKINSGLTDTFLRKVEHGYSSSSDAAIELAATIINQHFSCSIMVAGDTDNPLKDVHSFLERTYNGKQSS